MATQPIFSVITPVYNGERYIARCYASLAWQTFRDWEWVVVDDGSTDGTAAAVASIADDRIKLVSYGQNRGCGHARTCALAKARGAWVVIWDADDLYFPDRLEQINRARLAGYEFFCSYAVLVDGGLNIKGTRGFFRFARELPRVFVHPTLACRTELARAIGYDPAVRISEDAIMLWRLSLQHRGLWFEDALTIYQEGVGVNLWKAIASNRAQLAQVARMFRAGAIAGSRKRWALHAKYLGKLAVLNCLRLYPALYLQLVPRRTAGEIKPGWRLSQERLAFTRSLKTRFARSSV